MECASEVGAKCSCHAPRLPRNSQEGPKLFTLEPKEALTSSERKLPPTTGRHRGLDSKKEGVIRIWAYSQEAYRLLFERRSSDARKRSVLRDRPSLEQQ